MEEQGVGEEQGVHASDTHNVQEPPARPSLRVLALNMCLLPAGFNFSGSFLVDGDDRKAERLGMLVDLIEDYDIVLLNEVDAPHRCPDPPLPLWAATGSRWCRADVVLATPGGILIVCLVNLLGRCGAASGRVTTATLSQEQSAKDSTW